MKNILRGRLFGHPVHPMLVHFPTALFTTGFLFSLAGYLFSDTGVVTAAFYSIGFGLVTGLAAGFFGFIDYIKLADREPEFKKASWHSALQLLVMTVFTVIFVIKYREYPDLVIPGPASLSVMGAALVVMMVANYLGGDLVFRHGVGIHGDEEESSPGL